MAAAALAAATGDAFAYAERHASPPRANTTKHRPKGKSFPPNGAREVERRRKRIAAGKLTPSGEL